MLAWVKKLIHLRRTTVSLNDGDLGHVKVDCRTEERLLIMQRGTVRVLANFGNGPVKVDLREGERLRLCSRDGIALSGAQVAMPKMSFAVLDVKDGL
jgi:maltooligosyltrehalose trehalohydrolase